MSLRDDEPRPGERCVTQIDPETGRITNVIEDNLLLAPFHGLAELLSDIARGRMRTRGLVVVAIVLAILAR